jgi:hypothetical protein
MGCELLARLRDQASLALNNDGAVIPPHHTNHLYSRGPSRLAKRKNKDCVAICLRVA